MGWHNSGGRAPALAAALGFEIHYFGAGSTRRIGPAAFRYVRSTVRTIALLRRRRPDLVVITNPPIFAALAVYLGQLRYGGRFVIDSHTGAFVDGRWRVFLFLHRFLSRRAFRTVVHNSAQASVVDSWGVEWLQLGYVPIEMPHDGALAVRRERPYVLAACAGAVDEPLDAIAEAARSLPELDILLSGRVERLRQHLSVELPPNVQLLGYLDFERYLAHVHGARAVLALTTRAGTLVNGGFEAIAARRPLVTSDTEVLREYFDRGTVHTGSTAPEIADAIADSVARAPQLEHEMGELAGHYEAIWQQALPVLQPRAMA
ncbi:MAG: glycosyltransferase [Acidimicrobiales bacterium]